MSPSMELAAGVCKDALSLDALRPKSAKHSCAGQHCTDVACPEVFYSAAFWPCTNLLHVADRDIARSHGIGSWPFQEMKTSTCNADTQMV